MIKAYLVDDEQPALDRLARMLDASGRVELVGMSADPVRALEDLPRLQPDVLFLDIHMPELSGFELLGELRIGPLIVFTTAYDQHALRAFQEHAVDYLLKPISSNELDRALSKIDRFIQGTRDFDVAVALNRIVEALDSGRDSARLAHLTSQIGQKLEVIDIADVTHIFAQDKLTHAVTLDKSFVIDQTIAELEEYLDSGKFVRIHRGVILNLAYLREVHTYFGGRAVVRLKDRKGTELIVARARVRALKEKLGTR